MSSTVSSFVGELERMNELEGMTVFEAKTVRTGQKRKREDKGDPGDLEGYKGPWRGYVDQETVSRPTKEQMAILEEQFGDKQKAKKEKDETIEESSMLHSEWEGLREEQKKSGRE